MAQLIEIHPQNPQSRLIKQVVDIITQGGVIVYPTDSCFALGWHIGDKNAMERVCTIRRLDNKHNFTLMCRNISEVSTYAKLDNLAYRLIKSLTPGPYTFILDATREVPRRLQHAKRKTIGVRIPDNRIALAILDTLAEPLMSTSLILPGQDLPLIDSFEIQELLDHQVDLIIDGSACGVEPTTVIEFIDSEPTVIRSGKGDTSFLLR